jgi:hypothetical protein
MDKTIIRAIDAVLSDWAKLDDKHKGLLYNDAVESLKQWKDKLEALNV